MHTPTFSYTTYYAPGQFNYASLSNIKIEASEMMMASAMFFAILSATQCINRSIVFGLLHSNDVLARIVKFWHLIG